MYCLSTEGKIVPELEGFLLLDLVTVKSLIIVSHLSVSNTHSIASMARLYHPTE